MLGLKVATKRGFKFQSIPKRFSTALAYAKEETRFRLLKQTISENLWNTVKKYPNQHALIVDHQK
jgi:endonuclease III-like uncharacterized protein